MLLFIFIPQPVNLFHDARFLLAPLFGLALVFLDFSRQLLDDVFANFLVLGLKGEFGYLIVVG